MAPKGRAKSNGSKLPWETEIVVCELSDSEWTTQVHFLLGEDENATNIVNSKLKKSVGTRQKFSLITADMVLDVILDKKNKGNGRFCEVLDSCKTSDNVDITELSQLNPSTLAKVVKFMLLKDRDSDLARIQLKAEKEESKSGRTSAGKSGKKSPTKAASAKKKKGKKGKESPESDVKKDWSALKKRGEVDEEEEKEEYIDDEPDDGPTHYTIISGFSDSNLPLLLSEMMVEINSIIQIRDEMADEDNTQKYEFWSDLPTIFKRSLHLKRLTNCTRWQLTAFEHDIEGTQIFDEVASLCYDLMDQYKAYTGFNTRLKLFQIPGSDFQLVKTLRRRYQQQLDTAPLVAQSVNVIVHAMREAVVQCSDDVVVEEKIDKKDDLRTMLNSALSSFDLSASEQTDLSGILAPLTSIDKNQNVMVHYGDEIGQRLAGVDGSRDVQQIEEEMLKLMPCTALFTMTDDNKKRTAHSHLADIDHHLAADGTYSQSQIKRILLQMSTEAIPLCQVDENGKVVHPGYEAMIPWDQPEQLTAIDAAAKARIPDLSDWSVYERLNELSTIQEINGATRNAAAVELLPLNRENAAIVLCHDPLGQGSNANQNLTSWSETVISDLGFRQWMEHIQPSLSDWLRQWELEQTRLELLRQQEETARIEATRVSSGMLNQEPTVDDTSFVLPGSLKALAIESAKAASESDLKRKKSSRKSLTKSGKNSRSSSRTNSKTKVKKASRSSSRNSNASKDKNDKVSENDPQTVRDTFPQYSGYSLDNTLLVASGTERRIYTGDGGNVRIKQSGFLNQGDNMSICIDHGGNSLHYFQSRPREVTGTSITVKPSESNTALDIETSSDPRPKTSESSLSLAEPLEVPSAAFASVSAVFSDGLSVSYSSAGALGRPSNFDAEILMEDRKYGHGVASTSPTPSRDTATPKGRAKSPKGKKKEKSDVSLHTEPSKEESEVNSSEQSMFEETSIQQLYISTPDGIAFRFGVKNEELFVRLYLPDMDESCRLVQSDAVIHVYESGEYEKYNFDGSIDTGKVAENDEFVTCHITQNGECTRTLVNGSTTSTDETIMSYTGTDPTNGDTMTVRADGFTTVKRETEQIYQFPDATRVTRSENDIQIEKPGVPCVLFEDEARKCLVILANGTLIQVESNGSYHLSHQSGASFAVGEDGTVLFTPQSESTSTHIIRQQDTNALEIIEPDGLTTIQVSNTGKTAILHSVEESEESIEKINIKNDTNPTRSRYFYLRPDHTALEFFQESIATTMFNAVNDDPMSAAIFQQVPEAPHEKAVTLLSPFVPKTTWAINNYQEESIVPQYLRQSDLTQCGKKNSNFFESQNIVENDIKPPMLTMRNFVIADKVTNGMKEYVWEHVSQLGDARLIAMENTAEELEPAHSDERENGIDRRELLDRFLQLASEPDIDALRNSWVEVTRPPPPAPVEPPRPKLTDADWAKIKEEEENTRNGLKALKKRDVPNYWESEVGKQFLASGDQNVATKAAQELPKEAESKKKDQPVVEKEHSIVSEGKCAKKTGQPSFIVSSKHVDRTDQYEEQIQMEKIMGYKVAFGLWGYRCDFSPTVADFGHLIEGNVYSMNIRLQNSGFSKLRYKVRAQSKAIDIKYKIGPLAPGLASNVTITFKATGGVLREDGIYDFVSGIELEKPIGEAQGELQTDTTIELPVIARIIPLSEVERLKVLGKATERLNRNVKKLKT